MLGVWAIALQACGPGPTTTPARPTPPHALSRPMAQTPPDASPPPAASRETSDTTGVDTCEAGLTDAARQNDQSLRRLAFAPFHRAETGWEVYAPLMAHEIGTRCGPDSAAFASAWAAWQSAHGRTADGVVDAATFASMAAIWQARRPFVAVARQRCPAPPPESGLVPVPADQSYGGKTMLLRPAVLAAYERMLASARTEGSEAGAAPRLMAVFSAYRSPAYDAARCAQDGNCQGVVRATCSPHRTGLAVDINLGAAQGYGPDSSDDANRLYIAQGAAYRWMVANAGRFGFVPYPFEPWHWEWTGDRI